MDNKIDDTTIKGGMMDNKIDDETAYLKSIPGMAEKIKRGMETPLSECFKIDVTREMLGIEEKE